MYEYKVFGNCTYVTKKYEKLKYIFEKVTVVKAPYSSQNKWYIQVKLQNNDAQFIQDFNDIVNNDLKVKIQQSVINNNMIFKLPFRYNKFELDVKDKDGDFCTVYEIHDNTVLDIECIHASISKQNYDNVLSTWKVNLIKINND